MSIKTRKSAENITSEKNQQVFFVYGTAPAGVMVSTVPKDALTREDQTAVEASLLTAMFQIVQI